MIRLRAVLFLLLAGLFAGLASCGQSESGRDAAAGVGGMVSEIPLPVEGPGGEPNLFVGADGRVYLSWINYSDDTTDVLLFATLEGDRWSTPRSIAAGSDWFVNWADFPSLAVYPGGEALAAHWLAKSAGGTYDYDVHISQSTDGGQSWGPSFIPHTDGVSAEHGFVTLMPLSADRMMAVWLDGRNTRSAGSGNQDRGSHEGHGAGAMTLRTATFDPAGNLYDESELDPWVCDCCQTDAALTDQGPVVIYRDRSEEEIRDIYLTRRVDGSWTVPQPVFSDNWQIAGCPVNGPAIDARGMEVAAAWFSAAEGEAQVKVAFSADGGATFGAPVRIDSGNPLGRVDLLMVDVQTALVTWLESAAEGADIRAVRVGPTGILGPPVTLVRTSESRQSGFPILVQHGEDFLLAWTAVDSTSTTTVRTGRLNL